MDPHSQEPPTDLKQLSHEFGTSALNFAKAEYKNFSMEFSLAGKELQDYVVHFFVPKDAVDGPELKKYWLEEFPQILSDTAQDVFAAGPDRLRAAYTEEMISWWFRAYGFASGLDPVAKISRFFDKLDAELTAKRT